LIAQCAALLASRLFVFALERLRLLAAAIASAGVRNDANLARLLLEQRQIIDTLPRGARREIRRGRSTCGRLARGA
jgi:hypothetical protein